MSEPLFNFDDFLKTAQASDLFQRVTEECREEQRRPIPNGGFAAPWDFEEPPLYG